MLAERLPGLLRLARATGMLRQVFIWGSFTTSEPFPRDIDIFLLMRAGFDDQFSHIAQPQRSVFDHEQARLQFEADVLWATEAIGAETLTSWLSVYQLSRTLEPRGIVEVIA